MAVQIQESAGERAALAAAIKGTIPSMATAFTSWVLTTYGGFDALATSIVSSFAGQTSRSIRSIAASETTARLTSRSGSETFKSLRQSSETMSSFLIGITT